MEAYFKDKNILVTGAGRGIGRAVAIALSRKECQVYALSRTQEHLDSLVKEYPTVIPLTVDLANWTETRTILESLEALDGLVNNAGILLPSCSAVDVPKDDIEKGMEINVYSAINCIQVIGKKMMAERKNGSIVNVSSVASITASNHMLAYCLSKAGMDMITKQFALELGPFNIRVNAVNPTLVLTDTARAYLATVPEFEETITSRTPLERLPEVDEVVGPILYFLSDLSTSVTGSIHLIDGGRLYAFKY